MLTATLMTSTYIVCVQVRVRVVPSPSPARCAAAMNVARYSQTADDSTISKLKTISCTSVCIASLNFQQKHTIASMCTLRVMCMPAQRFAYVTKHQPKSGNFKVLHGTPPISLCFFVFAFCHKPIIRLFDFGPYVRTCTCSADINYG